MMNAIMMPRPINVTGTATAALIPGEHIPVHEDASERTLADPLVEEAAAGEVNDVLSVEPVGDIIEFDSAEPDSARDVAPGVIVGAEDV